MKVEKKIIFFIRTSSPFLTQRKDIDFIITNLIKEGYLVDLYDSKKKILMKINSEEIINYNLFKFKSPIKFFSLFTRIFSLIYFTLKNKGQYNIVQLSYIQEEYLLFPHLIKSVGKKLILNLYGSDINQRNFIKNYFTKIYDLADFVVATNKSFLENANSLIKKTDILSKSKILMLPQKQLELYADFTFENKNNSKQKLEIPSNKLTISLGTSGINNEQLTELIPIISSSKHFINLFFIINIAKNNSSVEQMKDFIFKYISPQNCYIIESYLSDEDMAIVRHSTDLFINVRKNDQLAASLIESNLSYTSIITGAWLPYEDYKQTIKVVEIDTLKEVNQKINEYLVLDQEILKKQLENNKQNASKKYDLHVLRDWIDFYAIQFK